MFRCGLFLLITFWQRGVNFKMSDPTSSSNSGKRKGTFPLFILLLRPIVIVLLLPMIGNKVETGIVFGLS